MLDSPRPKVDIGTFMGNETRFRVVEQQNPDRFRNLLGAAQREAAMRFSIYEQLSKLAFPTPDKGSEA